MRTVFTFRSSLFNTTVPREYFINPDCFGDDLVRCLIEGLRARAVLTDLEGGQEDSGRFFNFSVAEGPHCCVVGFRPDEPNGGVWIGWVERRASFLASLLGRRSRGIALTAPQRLHDVLSSTPGIDELRWHLREEFDAGQDNLGASVPGATAMDGRPRSPEDLSSHPCL